MGFKGVQPLQRVNQSNLLAVLTVMSNILETSQIRDGLGYDDDYSDYVHVITLLLYLGYGSVKLLILITLKATN